MPGSGSFAGWIRHDLVGVVGSLLALVPSCVGHVRRTPINLLYLNCNCCSQFAYHHAC